MGVLPCQAAARWLKETFLSANKRRDEKLWSFKTDDPDRQLGRTPALAETLLARPVMFCT